MDSHYPSGAHMILSVGHMKGGVGKTLLAVNIAAVLAQVSRDVLLIDGDEQGSAATFAQLRAELPQKAEFATIQLQGAAIRQQMKQLREKYNQIVIDVGGRDTGSLRAADGFRHDPDSVSAPERRPVGRRADCGARRGGPRGQRRVARLFLPQLADAQGPAITRKP